jgi:hypothetical protein
MLIATLHNASRGHRDHSGLERRRPFPAAQISKTSIMDMEFTSFAMNSAAQATTTALRR